MRLLRVARWWGVSPDAVERWAFSDFEDREEFMLVREDLDRPRGTDDADGGTEWEGRQ